MVSGTSSLGGTTGAALGGIAGSSIGRSSRDGIARQLLELWRLAGAAIEASATKQAAFEYIINQTLRAS